VYCFFFQAEDGIRDRTVTGVQTCALPISKSSSSRRPTSSFPRNANGRHNHFFRLKNINMLAAMDTMTSSTAGYPHLDSNSGIYRSEERRVGKECSIEMSAEQ